MPSQRRHVCNAAWLLPLPTASLLIISLLFASVFCATAGSRMRPLHRQLLTARHRRLTSHVFLTKRTSGNCGTGSINTLPHCAAACKTLNMGQCSNTKQEARAGRPAGCFLHKNDHWHVNKQTSSADCSADMHCICANACAAGTFGKHDHEFCQHW